MPAVPCCFRPARIPALCNRLLRRRVELVGLPLMLLTLQNGGKPYLLPQNLAPRFLSGGGAFSVAARCATDRAMVLVGFVWPGACNRPPARPVESAGLLVSLSRGRLDRVPGVLQAGKPTLPSVGWPAVTSARAAGAFFRREHLL